ncbi:MAG TPA: GrpB family protein [Polyangiaceae bacterium]|jgi:GrpB-like predicted nucleotidyltransferase (UPF0157 family)
MNPDPADAPIELVPYDPTWPALFARECERLAPLLANWLVAPIEHVGSTAVVGLLAKPVIDLMAPVHDLASSRPAIEALVGFGYCYFPYRAEVMHWFCRPSAAHRTHHLHLVSYQSALWRERLAFRDALRRDGALAEEYATLKRELAERHRFDRDAYTDGKLPFLERVLRHR